MFKTLSSLDPLTLWLTAFVVVGLVAGIASGFFKARKIQPKGFKWIIFRNEAIFAVITVTLSAFVLGFASNWLKAHGIIKFHMEPTAWWVSALEYIAYFIGFDTWFYWLHRWMHKEPVYSWVHKLHHRSTAPNLLTTFSVHPLESFINGGFVPVFTSLLTLHSQTMVFISLTAPIMGLYVHSGYEFFPRWWNKSWATKWFITATFHDQHHKYFTANFGGYTTVWDRICGTMRPKFEDDYLKLKDRAKVAREPVATPAE